MIIYLKDVFDFDGLIKSYQEKGAKKRIKLRFNTDWGAYNYAEMLRNKEEKFVPLLLTNIEKKSRNREDDIQFQFIKVGGDKWLFVGAYEIKTRDSLTFVLPEHQMKYAEAQRLEAYDPYNERLLVDFTNKSRNFFYVKPEIYNAVKVETITSQPYFEQENNFPGFYHLSKSYYDLKQSLESWEQILSEVYGVYLITDKKTGQLYVGSATGQSGIYGRWATYLSSDGYDKSELEDSQYPNVKLKELVNKEGIAYIEKNFQYTVLEIFNKDEAGKRQALEREGYWKQVLQSREFGYNRN
jgi:hypothetical protein